MADLNEELSILANHHDISSSSSAVFVLPLSRMFKPPAIRDDSSAGANCQQ